MAINMNINDWTQLETSDVRMIVAKCRRQGSQAATLALRLWSLRSFLNGLVEQGILTANPAKTVRTPKNKRHLPKNIDVDEVNQLLNIDLAAPLSVRDRTMLEVMYGAGLRLSELVNLNCQHLDLPNGEVWVMGKGSKERKIPLGRIAVEWLIRWLEMRQQYVKQDEAVFILNPKRKAYFRSECTKAFCIMGNSLEC